MIASAAILLIIGLVLQTARYTHGVDKKEAVDTLHAPNIVNANDISVDLVKTPLVKEETYGHKKGHTGDLITKKGGEYICFTSSEWQKVPDKSAYTKLGVVVNDGSCPAFYVALHDKAGGEKMTWDEAVARYGEGVLPSKGQGEAMIENEDKINNAMRAFGGTVMDKWYWGKEYDYSHAWYVSMIYGTVTTPYKTYTVRVRPVARVAEAAI